MIFKEGLLYSGMTNDVRAILVHTVDIKEYKYSLRLYSSATQACELQDIIGRTTMAIFAQYVEGNMIPTAP